MRLGKEGVEMLSSVLNTAILSAVEASTSITQDESINTISDGVMTTVDGTIATFNIADVLKVDLRDNSIIEVIAEEQLLLNEDEPVEILDEYRISMVPLAIDDVMRGIDSRLRIVEQREETTFAESHGLEGEKTVHSVPHVNIDDNLTIVDSGELSSADSGATYREGLAILSDIVTASESRQSTIQAYGIADMLLNEKRNFLLKKSSIVTPVDKMEITTTRAFFDTGGFDALGYIARKDNDEMSSADILGYSIEDKNIVEGQDSNSSIGINKMDYSSMTVAEAEALYLKIMDYATGLDQSTVSSNNEIDAQ
jgi:hypothetical protein